MIKHTPGPWLTVEDNHIGMTGPFGSAISLRIIWDEDKTRDVAYAYENADARLIAVAPELLEFIKTQHEKTVHETEQCSMRVHRTDKPGCKTCALIAKAEIQE